MNELPDKPSELIRVALADLEKCKLDPRYSIDMLSWHQFDKLIGVCHVCLAGAVMAKTFQCHPELCVNPYNFPREIASKLHALNAFRTGAIIYGLNWLKIEIPDSIRNDLEVKSRSLSVELDNEETAAAVADILERNGL
jgi:hypothetical protein